MKPMKHTKEVVTKIQKVLLAAVATIALIALTTAVTPWAPALALALGATPSSQTVPNVSTTSGAVFVQLGWNRLTCSSDVYYKVVATSSTAVTAATGTLLRGPQGSNGLPKPAWILVSSDQWLALLLKAGTNATCMVETVSMDGSAGSFTTLAVSSTSTFTGQAQFDGFVQGQDAGFNNIKATGTASINGALTSAGVISGIFDGGAAVLTTINTSSTASIAGTLAPVGGIDVATNVGGELTLNGASPSVITATVISGSKCVCSQEGTAANPIKCAVSGTTLTITGPNGATDLVTYLCFL